MMGPMINPIFDAIVHQKITQIRACELNMSSIVPPTIVPGTAERSPASARIMMAAGSECTDPITIQQTQLRALLKMYIPLRPNDSVHGGNTIVPTDCPSRNLQICQYIAYHSLCDILISHSVTKQNVAKVCPRWYSCLACAAAAVCDSL